MRTRTSRSAPLPRTLARFNRRFANPVMRRVAGWLPPFAIIRHRDRMTGRDRATPVLAFGTSDGLVIGVLYGTTSDWLRNVLAAGHAEVRRLGTDREYGHPQLVGRDEGLPLVPVLVRGPFRALGVRSFIRLIGVGPDVPST